MGARYARKERPPASVMDGCEKREVTGDDVRDRTCATESWLCTSQVS